MTKETTTSNRRRASRAAMRGSNKFRNSFCSEISAYSSTPDTTCFVAPFERSELSFGIKLGSGSFSDVYEITSFHLTGAGCGFSEEEIKKREAMARETLDPNDARYVLKQIKLGMERRYVSVCMINDLQAQKNYFALAHNMM